MIIKIKDERLSPLQAYILMRLRKGPRKARELVEELARLGVRARSSVYTAIYELMDRGIVERAAEGRELVLKLSTRGLEIARELPGRVLEGLKPLASIIAYLAGESSIAVGYESLADAIDDPEELEAYKRFLLEELRKVEEKISRWKRIEVE